MFANNTVLLLIDTSWENVKILTEKSLHKCNASKTEFIYFEKTGTLNIVNNLKITAQ